MSGKYGKKQERACLGEEQDHFSSGVGGRLN